MRIIEYFFMFRRGIGAAPVLNGYCGDYEFGMPNSVIYESVFNYGWPSVASGSGAASNIDLSKISVFLASIFAMTAYS